MTESTEEDVEKMKDIGGGSCHDAATSAPLIHEVVTPLATYAPWKADADFISLFNMLKPFTLVDHYRCFELWHLIEQCSKLDEGAIIEVGVWRGGTGALLASKARLCNITDPVYLCDTFRGVVKASGKDSSYKGSEHDDTSVELVMQLINALKLRNVYILEGTFPEETADLLGDIKVRFSHIDVDVYNSARDAMEWIWPRMRPGGIVVFDDYGFKGCDGVTKYVEEQKHLRDRLIIHNLNGHAVVVKLG